MNKLKLQDLAVESFDTTTAEDSRGTVIAEQCTCPTNCTCPGCPSCDPSYCDTACQTCPYSCYGSCDGSCDPTCVGYATCSWNTNCEA